MKNMTDFRKTVETGVDPRLIWKVYKKGTVSVQNGTQKVKGWTSGRPPLPPYKTLLITFGIDWLL